MRKSQRAKAFQLVSSEREPLKPKTGFVYKIDDAEALHKMIVGNRLHGAFKSGDYVLALREKGDNMVYTPVNGDPTNIGGVIDIDPYATFTLYGKPGPTVCELPALMIASLMGIGCAPVQGMRDIDDSNFHAIPGTIQMVENADQGFGFSDDLIETASMQGKLKEGDLVLIIKYLDHGKRECALMEPLSLGWRELADSRFVADQPNFGRAAAILGGHEYLTIIQGGLAYYKDHGRTMDFGRTEILNEVQRGWPQP